MKRKQIRRLRLAAVLGLAVAGIAAASAQSAVRPNDRAGTRGVEAGQVLSQPSVVRPDDRGGIRGVGVSPTSSQPLDENADRARLQAMRHAALEREAFERGVRADGLRWQAIARLYLDQDAYERGLKAEAARWEAMARVYSQKQRQHEQSQAVRPDDRAGIHGVGELAAKQSTPVRPDDRAGIRGVETEFETPVVVSTSNSSDWPYILGGALGGVLLLFLIGVAVHGMQRREQIPPSSPATTS